MKAVCLLSGGLDSSTVCYIAKARGFQIYALSFDYGQRHIKEIESAKKIAELVGAKEHKILKINLDQIGGSALTDDLEVPHDRNIDEMSREIPITYVPMRNTILLALAAAYAEVIEADAIFAGMNAVDYSGYPDCRPEYIKAMQETIRLGSKLGVKGEKIIKIETPIIKMSKAEIIKEGMKLGVPYQYTWSCYHGKEKACGICDSCVLRLNGFKEAGLIDPIDYEK
ncbi:MAG: 7-cyano-7-deazaguanine synthase QueC [Candidatus Lokiarchaeota archaeon]|nr:7-cyano-7-deazaguanine synthase QueC [Candidatus Lokiarchaeota archaeon]